MHKKRNRLVLSIAVMLALLAGSLPMTFSAAMENTQAGDLQCPPMDASMLQVPGYLKSLPAECRGLRTSAPAPFTQSMSTLLATGGPDDFGYTYDDTVPFSWISATNDSGVIGDENYSQPPFDIGFNFPFHGSSYSQLLIHTNGFLTFDPIITCCFWTSSTIPNPALPNNYIAPFWDDLAVGPPYNSGAIYYERGGTAPDRFLVVEWRDVTPYFFTSDPFSFEVILYENGDILTQIQSVPTTYVATVGIENQPGDDGLQYFHGSGGLLPSTAVRFTYPTGAIPRLAVSPRNTGKFASASANTNFPINISNPGSAGTDTYDLAIEAAAWSWNFYQDDCITPLTDTDGDTVIDTGPLSEGASTTVCVSFTPPVGAGIGDMNTVRMVVASSLDPTKTRDVWMNMSVAAPFAQVFEDYENAAMAFQTNGPDGPTTNYVTEDFYFANGLAMMRLPDGRYVYVWRKPDGSFGAAHSNIELSILNADGSFDVPVMEVTNTSGMGQTYDYDPAVAVAPNGNIGVTWYRWIVDNTTGLFNYNMYFAMLSGEGDVLFPPTPLTDNDLYDDFDNLDVPHYFSPAIAATDDNRFVVAWQDHRTDAMSIFDSDIWLTTRDSNGSSLGAATRVTSDGNGFGPVLNSLTGNDVILTYVSDIHVTYMVVNSSGLLSAPQAVPGALSSWTVDAVMLPNGRTALAWTGLTEQVGYALLDETYNLIGAPTFAANSWAGHNRDMSVTFDSSNHVIMTWADNDADTPTRLFYAMANDTGSFITSPHIYRLSTIGMLGANGVITSGNGQGNAPILPSEPPVLDVNIDIVPGSAANIITRKLTVVQVAILSSDGFNALTDVDRSSLTFGRTGNEHTFLRCLKNGRDVNHDGRLDLICQFSSRLTGLVPGDTQAILRGLTVTGVPFEASDSVRVLNGSK